MGVSTSEMAPHEQPQDNALPPNVVYLTGASGFLGGQILKDITAQPHRFSKVYLPVRTKKGMSGQERFDSLFGSYKNRALVYCDAAAPIPPDTTTVILNAYSISFNNDVSDTLRDNVAPMLHLLDQCVQLPRIDHVVVVSTAYVQPYLPFKMCKAPIPCHASDDPERAYEQVLSGELSWEDLKQDTRNHPHTLENAYVYSKTLMEHLVTHRYQDKLPMTIFRPSIISCSSDGTYGSRFTPPCATGMLAQSKLGRVFPRTANADHVHCDHVSRMLLNTATNSHTKGSVPVVLATGNCAIKPDEYKYQLMGDTGCYTLFFDMRVWWQCWIVYVLRAIELMMIRLLVGAKIANLIGTVYSNYDHFLTETWDFEPNLPIDLDKYYPAMRKWLKENPPPKPRKAVKQENTGSVKTKLSLLMVPLFVLIGCLLCCIPSAQGMLF